MLQGKCESDTHVSMFPNNVQMCYIGLLHFKSIHPLWKILEKCNCRRSVNLIPMRCTCDTHEVCMWYPCGVHVISMWCAYDIQVTEQWATPFLKFIHPRGRFWESVTAGGVWIVRCTYLLCNFLIKFITWGVSISFRSAKEVIYSPIAFDERVTFWLQRTG